MPHHRDTALIFAAGSFRSLVAGATGVLLAVFLFRLDWSVGRIGLLITTGLAGTAVATLFTGFFADHWGRRKTLFLLSVLTLLGSLALAYAHQLPAMPMALLVAAFFGMINGLGRDRGPAYALDQVLLSEVSTAERRTFTIAWYSLLLDAGLALGSFAAGLPVLLQRYFAAEAGVSFRAVWFFCAGISALNAILYTRLTPAIELAKKDDDPRVVWSSADHESRSRIVKLATLIGMDSFGGGFLSSALVSYWFFTRFDLGLESLGSLFAAARVANAVSHLVAAWLARRIGLLNTIVFTHLPSSIFLVAVPFAPSLPWAIVLFLLREGLVEMDVPTRQSFILAVVQPEERTLASSMTTFTRNIAYATAPVLAGWAMKGLSMASPLILGGSIKILYDLLLFFSFRRVKPPEET
jgi:MFS family permease